MPEGMIIDWSRQKRQHVLAAAYAILVFTALVTMVMDFHDRNFFDLNRINLDPSYVVISGYGPG